MMTLSALALAVNGVVLGEDVSFTSVGTDSRNIEPGQLFVALKGECFDGNQYAEQALLQGAAAVLISDDALTVRPAVLVKDSRLALGQLAAYWRQTMPARVVAVTGSNGKTTTKEMLAAILVAASGDAASVHATAGNLNNDIGLPLTLLKTQSQHRYVEAEMGMNHLGEIDYLTHIARPNVAVINNAGIAHIGELGSRENIAKAKGEIFAGLDAQGVAVMNADDAFFSYWQSLNTTRKVVTFALHAAADVTATYAEFEGHLVVKFKTPEGIFDTTLQVMGQHNVYNALAASATAVALGISNAHIAQGLAAFSGVYGRLQRKLGLNGATLIDDTYNANPDSMKAAIDVLSQYAQPRIFVMGDMGELGANAAEMHASIGRYAKEKGIEKMLSFGELSRLAAAQFGAGGMHFDALDALIDHVNTLMKQGVVVLVKGSRFMRMERVVQALQENKTENKEKAPCC